MSGARDVESLHEFVDRLTPTQVAHLRALATQDAEFRSLFGHVGHGRDPGLSSEVRRLRARVRELEAELGARRVQPTPTPEPAEDEGLPEGMLALFGSITDGPTDMAERHGDYIRERMRRRFGDSV
jgi:hypothetical protein